MDLFKKGIVIGALFMLSISCKTDTIKLSCEPQSTISNTSTKDADTKLLEQLLVEIKNEANSKICNDSKNWQIVELGQKACGGPAAYIAYSEEIDVDCFLKKVEFYTKQTKIFNQKYSIVSDCMLLIKPAGIKCENGKPVFVTENQVGAL